MQSFLEEVVDETLKSHHSLEDLIFILPSKRAGSFLKDLLVKKCRKTVFAPKIYSIERFVETLSGLEYASGTQLLFELYRAYLETGPKKPDSFYDFSKWGQILLQDFNEIDRYLIDSQKLFAHLSTIREVEHWSVQEGKTPLIENYLRFWKSLEPIYSGFREHLSLKNIGYQGMVYRKACELLDAYLLNAGKSFHVFIGFNALNNAESILIQRILETGRGDIYWDTDPYFVDDPIHDAGYFIRRHKQHWPYFTSHPLKGLSSQYTAPKQIRITAVPKNVSLVKYVGTLLAELQQEQGALLKHTAVVLGDELLLNPLLHSIPPEIGPVNITMGYPLGHTPLQGLFSRLFDLYLHKGAHGWYHGHVLSLLSHPYTEKLLSDGPADHAGRLREIIRDKNWIHIPPGKLLSLPGIPARTLNVLFIDGTPSPGNFLSLCLKITEELKQRFQGSSDPIVLEQLYRFYTLFNQLQEYLVEFPYIRDLKTLQSLYQTLLSGETVDFRGEPLEGLQIMGMLESRNLDFETVILTSVNEGILPSGKSSSSFIPYDLKREFGLPTYKEKDAVYTYHFYRLLQRAKRVFLLYNTEADILEGGEKSRLISQLLTDPVRKNDIEQVVAAPAIQPQTRPLQVIAKDRDIMEKIKSLAARGFSPSSLTSYIRNPIDFYKRAILKIDEALEVDETITSKVFGNVVHHSLESLYTPFIGRDLDQEMLRSLQPKIKGVVRSHFAESYLDADIGRGKNLIAYHVLVRYVERLIAMDMEAVQDHTIRILALEKEVRSPIEVPGLDYPVYLRGYIDRIDTCDGRIRIIDYKTGNVTAGKLQVSAWEQLSEDYEYSKAFQLLCYAYMYMSEEAVASVEAGIISLKNLNQGMLRFAVSEGNSRTKKDPVITAEVLALFKDILDKLLMQLCDPAHPLTEKAV